VKVAGLASVYASVFRTWLDDDDPGLARTMAALDRRLRRGERTFARIEDGLDLVRRMVAMVSPQQSRASRASSPPSSPPPGDDPSPAPGPVV
jgi:hypothetical protein